MKNDNPLNSIFVKNTSGKLSDEINDIKNISHFFKFLKDEKINVDTKIKVLDEFKKKIQTNRFISEFFSEYENKSIYIHLFDLYTKKSSTDKLKTSITSLIEELILNIQTGKEVYEYIFQNLAKIYRNEIKPNAENVYIYLKLLGSILGETDNIIIPKNYFSCSGGKFEVDFKEKPINIEYSFTININFKIAKNLSQKNEEINLVKLCFSNEQQFNINLKPPCELIIPDIQTEPILKLKDKEWNNLIITIANINNSLNLFVNLNGEEEIVNYTITNLSINFDDKISQVIFFNNFVGEVSSIYMFTQMDPGSPNIITTQYISELKKFKEGLWKKKSINDLFKILKSIPSVDFQTKTIYFKSTKLDKKDERRLYDNLIFLFTPLNYYRSNSNLIEDVLGRYQLKFEGNIKVHQFQNYQKKLLYVCEFSNFFPIAEMFLIYPETLNEQNFQLFLKIIISMLNYRKYNLKNIKQFKFFNILSLFIEKYPQKIFTEIILNLFFELGKIMFINNLEAKCSNYFKHILLNEKILSKYDSNLQIKFWNKLFLFHESDKEQVQTFLNINRLCLILRFYDRNKYTEMCCSEHLNMIKDEYRGSTKVMNPSLSQQLSYLRNLMDSIIDSQEPQNAIDLFKLLTLDLSPCLVKFILNVFISVFKKNKSEEWNKKFVSQLSQMKFEVIIINTFIHSLPDIRIELLKFVFQVHKRLKLAGSLNKFNIFEKMLKTCILPDQKFNTNNMKKKAGMNIANPPKKTNTNKEEPKNNNNGNNNNNINLNNNNNNNTNNNNNNTNNNNNNTNNNINNINNANQPPKPKSNFAELLSKFETSKTLPPKNSNNNSNNNYMKKHSTIGIKANEVQKKIENNENPFIKALKPIPKNEINKAEEKKIQDGNQNKPSSNENKISDDIKSKINKLNENKPKEIKPKENKPQEIKQKEIKPQENKPKESKPKENKQQENKPERIKPKENKPQEIKQKEIKPQENISKETKPKEIKPQETKLKENKSKETKPKEIKPQEIKPKENKSKETKPKEIKPQENKSKETKPKEIKPLENNQQEKKTVLKPIKEEKDLDINVNETKNRTFTVYNKNNMESNILAKKNIFEKASSFNEAKAIFEKKNTIHSVYQKRNTEIIPNNVSNIKKNINENKNNSNTNVINKNKAEKKNTTNTNITKNDIKDNNDKKNTVKTNSNLNKDSNAKKLENIISNQNSKNINITNKSLTKNVSIIKDIEINNYINQLYSMFILWATSNDIESNIDNINFNNSHIEFSNILDLIYLLNKSLKNPNYIIYFFKIIEKLMINPENCYVLFFTEKIYASFIDITFEFYKKPSKEEEECFNLGKNILVTLFINSFDYHEQKQNINPGNEVENLFLWGDYFLEENQSKEQLDLLLEFFYELFFEFLFQLKLKYAQEIKFDDKNTDLSLKNYILKNYLMLNTEIFSFVFKYRLEKDIHYKGLSFIDKKNQNIEIPEIIISSMRMKDNKSIVDDISTDWLDFPLIYDIFNKYKFIWVNNNVYKNLEMDKYKNEKATKYNHLIENLIFNKERKNTFISEIVLLCHEEKKIDFEIIIPLITIIPYSIMCILEKLKNSTNEKQFLFWLKDLKNYIRFVIIASSNLFKHIDSYKQIQENCVDVIAAGIFFMKNLYETSQLGKQKIFNSLVSLFLLCFKLLKWNFKYKSKHSGVLKKIILKQGTNDICNSSIVQIFNEQCKDENGNFLLTNNILESLCLDDDSKCINEISKFIQSSEFTNQFWENINLKNRLLNGFFSLNSFKKLADYRYDLIPSLQDSFDDSYKNTILDLLPQYETELAKYSNNSLEKNVRNKNKYKSFKKNAFSWRGYWSCRKDFFCENPKFKYKLINHYTKNFMKPVLVPILDINYYLPDFSGFEKNKLFRKGIPKENKINLDIDKVLKASEATSEDNNKEKNKGKKIENFLVNIYKKSNLVLYEKYQKISNNLEFGKEEEFAYIERDTKKNQENNMKKYFLSCLVKTSHHIKGVCFIDDNNLNFKVFLNQKTGSAMSGVERGFSTEDDDYDPDRQTCFGSYFVCHPKDKDLYKISINYNDIKWIFKRKYYYTNSAFEIYTTTNKSFYFNFKFENDRETVIEEILKKMQSPIPILDDLREGGNTLVGYENKFTQKKKKEKIKLSEIVKRWKNWEIDNFELLMWLNIFGNRSYNDISQYPIFPWVLRNYKDPLKEKTENSDDYDYQYRDMNLPLGMMELDELGRKRTETFLETYETLKEDPNEGVKPYLYGTSYSNPYYVCYYLIRLFPFSHISIELQGKKFDNANRLFFSVSNTFKNSTTQKTDVKELIPEFFYLPEMFLNINDLDMGILDNGDEVNDALIPCNNNAYDFIMTMKSILESNTLSYSLTNWVDLVFGFKSRGKEAENAYNVYTEASYQENIDITKVENKYAQLRQVEFGLIPNQIMTKECIKKDKKENLLKGKEITDSSSDLKYMLCKSHDSDKYHNKNLTVIKMGSFSSDKILVYYNNNTLVEKKINCSSFDKSYSYEDSNTIDFFKFQSKMSQYYYPKRANNKIIQFCQKGKLIILGGFYDGKVQLIPLESKYEPVMLSPFKDKLPILSIAVDKEEEFAFFGNSIGNVCINKIDKDPSKFKFYQTITHQMSPISHIDCNNVLNLWASGSIDGYINIYTLPLSKLIRIIKVPTNNLENVFLSESPLPSIIAITVENNISEIFVYSLNGKLLLRQKEEDLINCPLMIRDMNTNNYLAYIIQDNVVIRSLPNLIREVCIDGVNNIYSICPSEDMKSLYGLNKTGSEVYVIKEEKEKN